jgi:hypothetical protein
VACGDPLVDASYQGEPLMVLAGQVLLEDALPALEGQVRVALFWSSQGEHGQQHEQQVAISTSFPSRYELTLYTPPPDEVLYQPPHVPSPVGIALPMLYEDVDGDGVYSSGSEQVLGGSQDVLVLFNADFLEHRPPEDDDDPPPADTGTLPGPLEPGYHAVRQLEDSCDHDDLVLIEVDPENVAMAIGELWGVQFDMDCDGDHDEWGDL